MKMHIENAALTKIEYIIYISQNVR